VCPWKEFFEAEHLGHLLRKTVRNWNFVGCPRMERGMGGWRVSKFVK
jgi:hypothetical protein